MDFISNNAIEVSTLALNGLSSRHNALAANIANADTEGYKRTDVKFEDQLSKILQTNDSIEAKKMKNSMSLIYSPNSQDFLENTGNNKNIYQNFKPETFDSDNASVKLNGNNVSIEYEMAELTKNGTKYSAIATFQEKMLKGLNEVIVQGGR